MEGIIIQMNILEKLQLDLHKAMKDQDVPAKRSIRLLLSSLKFAEISKGSKLEDSEILAIIQKEIKTKNETINDARKAERSDLIEESEDDIKVLEKYLPQQLNTDELIQIASNVISEVEATSIKDMGRVMKVLIEKLAGSASNQDASKVVKEILQSKS